MELTTRQENVLEGIITEYIKRACPVSSQMLEVEYDFDVSPATLRNEMQVLAEQGFLLQPHTSSGRVPTDKGYRFFVDEISEKESKTQNGAFDQAFSRHMEDALEFAVLGTKNLAALSSSLSAIYFQDREILWKEGWGDLLQEPEFQDQEYVKSFTRFLNDFENNVESIEVDQGVQVFIGKENLFSRVEEFSIVMCPCDMQGYGKGFVALLGPKRMAYPKNINILSTFCDLWKKNQ